MVLMTAHCLALHPIPFSSSHYRPDHLSHTSLSPTTVFRCNWAPFRPLEKRCAVVMGNAAMESESVGVYTEGPRIVDLNARRPEVDSAIREALQSCITESALDEAIPGLGPKIRGKVRNHLFISISFLFLCFVFVVVCPLSSHVVMSSVLLPLPLSSPRLSG